MNIVKKQIFSIPLIITALLLIAPAHALLIGVNPYPAPQVTTSFDNSTNILTVNIVAKYPNYVTKVVVKVYYEKLSPIQRLFTPPDQVFEKDFQNINPGRVVTYTASFQLEKKPATVIVDVYALHGTYEYIFDF